MTLRSNPLTNHRFVRWSFLSTLSGALSGIAAAIFLISLHWVTNYRLAHPAIIWLLPLAGLAIGFAYYHYGKDIAAGNNLILDEIHDPKNVVPFRMAPFILAGTLVTHLFGGSAGREGTAVQMGASLSDQLSRFFRISREERKILLTAGAGAGFGAAIGAPWAGIIFGMEVIQIGRLHLYALFECAVASFVAFYTAVALGAPHSVYPGIIVPEFSWSQLFFVVVSGALFGLAARGFTWSTHIVERTSNRWISYPPLKPFFGGFLLVLLYALEGSGRYAGLGISYIQEALTSPAVFSHAFLKSAFTSLTVATGFKGGEFIPLVYIGTTLGSALSLIFPVSFALLGAVGFAAVFAGASNAPLACSIMAIEIFGIRIAPYAFVGCFVSYVFSGHRGIYRAQRLKRPKGAELRNWLSHLFP